MPAHIHADNMLLFAEDAKVTETPWIGWECRPDGDKWRDLSHVPAWTRDVEYRRKPRTISINRIEIPEPIRVAPRVEEMYYVPDILARHGVRKYPWSNSILESQYLSMGLMHKTESAARLHLRALLSFTRTQESYKTEESQS